MKIVSEQNNFVYLLISLVVLLFVGALVTQFPSNWGGQVFRVVTVITLFSGVIGLKSSRLWYRTGIGFTISVLLIVILSALLDVAGLSYFHLLMLTLFYSFLTWLTARHVLFTGSIDRNRIVGAVCLYLLLGLIWALLYLFIAQAVPGAFRGMDQVVWYQNFADATYYSFVTLTTLGYGDITPVAPVARFLVYMEAIVGVFYMAILVASLIGIRISAMHSGNK